MTEIKPTKRQLAGINKMRSNSHFTFPEERQMCKHIREFAESYATQVQDNFNADMPERNLNEPDPHAHDEEPDRDAPLPTEIKETTLYCGCVHRSISNGISWHGKVIHSCTNTTGDSTDLVDELWRIGTGKTRKEWGCD